MRRPRPLPDWPAGTAVILTDDLGKRWRTATRSAPWVLGGHTNVVLVEGIAGGYLCDRLTPGTDESLPHFATRQNAREASHA